MLDNYDYSGVDSVCYSDTEMLSYKKAAEFLGESVEDWGCGTAWAKRYFKTYRGIDGSAHKNVDEIVDLTTYTSRGYNILLRQVLELNPEWRKVLDNVKKSFDKKLCIVIFTPLSENATVVGDVELAVSADGSSRGFNHVMMFFKREDILDYFPRNKFKVTEEFIPTQQGYKQDWVIYVERL